jgi:heme a synthase
MRNLTMIPIETALRFRRIGIITIAAVYFLILVGSTVRASGAGMGCPDWPTCFGQWIPPTDVSELPANYQEIYAQRGYQNTTFNPVKTWTEYMNRLTGVSIGVLIILTVWLSRAYRQVDQRVFYSCVSVLLLVLFQGWLGAAVVASNLKPFMITLHMLLALFIVALLIYAITRSQRSFLISIDYPDLPKKFQLILTLAVGMTLLQIAMGTQVREAVDTLGRDYGHIGREYWRESFPVIFYVHRSFSSVILFTNLWLAWRLHQTASRSHTNLHRFGYGLAMLVAVAILAGISLDRLGVPRLVQPIHLLMATLIFGAQFFIFMRLRYARKLS